MLGKSQACYNSRQTKSLYAIYVINRSAFLAEKNKLPGHDTRQGNVFKIQFLRLELRAVMDALLFLCSQCIPGEAALSPTNTTDIRGGRRVWYVPRVRNAKTDFSDYPKLALLHVMLKLGR